VRASLFIYKKKYINDVSSHHVGSAKKYINDVSSHHVGSATLWLAYSVACGWGGARDDWRHLTGHVNESRVYGVRGTYVGGLVRWTVHLLVVILYTVYAPLRQRRWTRRGSVDDEDSWINLWIDDYLKKVLLCVRHLRCHGAAPHTPF